MTDNDTIMGAAGRRQYSDNDERESTFERESMSARALPRVLTGTLIDALEYITDADQEWTRGLLQDYGDVDDKGPDGDVPDQPAFANDVVFWIMTFFGTGLGLVLGLCGLVFMNIIDEVRKLLVSL
jgi:hypothetical protein